MLLLISDHHKQKQLEQEKQQQELQDPGGQMMMATTTATRYGPGPRPRFAPTRVHTSQRQISPRSQSPGSVHPVSLTCASSQSGIRGPSVRHEPYPGARLKKTVNFSTYKRMSQLSSAMKLPTDPGSAQKNDQNQIIKTEPMDDSENTEKSSLGDSGTNPSATNETSSPSHIPLTQNPIDSSESSAVRDEGSESSSSTVVNESSEAKYSDSLPPGGLGLHSDLPILTGQMDNSMSDSVSVKVEADNSMNDSVSVKVEAITESELDDLEITGVEAGQMAQPDYGIMSNLQGIGFDPAIAGGAQGDITEQATQGYSKSLLNHSILCPAFIPHLHTCFH